jgi:hypothetical protein
MSKEKEEQPAKEYEVKEINPMEFQILEDGRVLQTVPSKEQADELLVHIKELEAGGGAQAQTGGTGGAGDVGNPTQPGAVNETKSSTEEDRKKGKRP